MPIIHIICSYGGCKRLVHNATPIPPGFPIERATSGFDTKRFCSKRCAEQDFINSITCCAIGCHRMITHETPTAADDPPKFDARKYCSITCARNHYRQDPLEASIPISTCDVCANDKPLTSFIHTVHPRTYDTRGFSQTNMPIPPYCKGHIMPERLDLETGICIDCISNFLKTQFKNRGARGIACIIRGCAPDPEDDPDYTDWRPRAHHFLPKALHAEFHQQAFHLWLLRTTKWECPTGCYMPDTVIDPNNTPGYPHIHCSGCDQRFCAGCRVPWHEGVTCQQYRAQHPEIRDKGEAQVLTAMANLNARRCPCCQYLIVKEGGCNHMVCEQCGSDFYWSSAERVVPIDDDKQQERPTRVGTEQPQSTPTDSSSLQPREDTPLNVATPAAPPLDRDINPELGRLVQQFRIAFDVARANFVGPDDGSNSDEDDRFEDDDMADEAFAEYEAEVNGWDEDEEQSENAMPWVVCEMDRIAAERVVAEKAAASASE